MFGGTDDSMGIDRFCGVQVHENVPNDCSGLAVDYMNGLTEAEAAECKAEVLAYAASQGGVCN
jgi:hypothetical protein